VSRSLSVVVATFEWPRALDVVLHALAEQRDRDFSVVVADDGSGEETAQAVERWRGELALSHVWQENEGFLKARLLNRAALAADGEYLLFLDGDCVPRRGLTASVRRAALPGADRPPAPPTWRCAASGSSGPSRRIGPGEGSR